MLYVLIAEAAIELVPKEIASHAQVQRDANKRGKGAHKMLLDSSRHWEAMGGLSGKEKLGRPDIAHFCLLTAMESIANKSGNMNVLVHTRNDELISINPQTRLPRVYERFTGLIEDLYERGTIKAKNGSELMSVAAKHPLENIIATVPAGAKKILFDPAGKTISLGELADEMKAEKDVLVAIGGFAHGKFTNEKIFDGFEKVSVSKIELAAWTALGMAVYSYEYSRKL